MCPFNQDNAMPDESSHAAFLRSVGNRHRDVRNAIESLIRAIMDSDVNSRLAKANDLRSKLRDLRDILSDQDRPAWIEPLDNKLSVYGQNQGGGGTGPLLLNHLLDVNREIVKWGFKEQSAAVDFDAVYSAAYRASSIPSLFDSVADLLEKIIQTGEIDSVKSMRRLSELAELLRTNRNGSYAATWTTWQLVTTALPSILYEYANESSAVGPLIRGVQTAMEKLGIEWVDVHARIRQTVNEKLSIDLPQITGRTLPRIASSTIEDGNTLDGDAEPPSSQEPKAG